MRTRITKYHKRTYWREAAMVAVIFCAFVVGVVIGLSV